MTSLLSTLSLAAIPPEDEALRGPVREFLATELRDYPLHQRARTVCGYDPDFTRALGARGWIGMNLPPEVGGEGRSHFARFVLTEEVVTFGAPVLAHWTADRQTAQLIARFGTPAQQARYIPGIRAGEIVFGIGLSEPDTGSDLASVRTRAVRTETGWRINGRKIWTSNGHRATHICALMRTSGTPEDRHKGLSQLIVDMKTPGISVRPILNILGEDEFCEVLFEDVDVPADALIGEDGDGWKQVTAELAFERSGCERIYSSVVLADIWLEAMRALDNPPPIVVDVAGRIAGRLSVLRAMSLGVCACLDAGKNPELEASLVKDLGTEFEQEVPNWIAEANASIPGFRPSRELSLALAYVTQYAPVYSIRGGSRHIMRGIIARGLGLR
ncbi:acyl-CoA dehydrogenase family protein [Cupriavidus sp. NPDC089707]|uniref:acyl-CoA dehydrogenase family protein n=1 Tax=Cupriavidus sp. NPDC089707 TaxID=3363963 RepID=UPI003804A98F